MDELLLSFTKSLQTRYVDKSILSYLDYQPELLVNQKIPPKKVLSTILHELENCNQFFISVAFVTTSGVAAIIINKRKIFCVQRGENKFAYNSKKYEFPDGKMEAGETKEDTIKRKILEELNMQIKVQSEFLTVTHQYPDFILTMHSFICSCEKSTLTLTEHIDFKWLSNDELPHLDWAAADIPIVNELIKFQL